MRHMIAVLVLACTHRGADEPPLASPTSPTEQAAPDTCVLDTPDAWGRCDGQRVSVLGRKPTMVHSHPQVGFPSPDGTRASETYLDVGERQIILVSSARITCPGEMTVTGILHAIDLGGPEGTPESYQGWSIRDATAVCH